MSRQSGNAFCGERTPAGGLRRFALGRQLPPRTKPRHRCFFPPSRAAPKRFPQPTGRRMQFISASPLTGRLAPRKRTAVAQVAELVDAPASGAGARKGVEVRVLSWAPLFLASASKSGAVTRVWLTPVFTERFHVSAHLMPAPLPIKAGQNVSASSFAKLAAEARGQQVELPFGDDSGLHGRSAPRLRKPGQSLRNQSLR